MASAERAAERAIADMLDTLYPVEREKHIEAMMKALDARGNPSRDYFRTILPPEKLDWATGETGKFIATARAGKSVLAVARAGTAPSTGACIITLRWESEVQGLTTLGTVRIPNGQRFGQSGPTEIGASLPAGAWVQAVVSTANGASNVSVMLALETGATT